MDIERPTGTEVTIERIARAPDIAFPVLAIIFEVSNTDIGFWQIRNGGLNFDVSPIQRILGGSAVETDWIRQHIVTVCVQLERATDGFKSK